MEAARDHDGRAYLLHGVAAKPTWYDVLRTAGPLLLAIAGSALSPLPCAFSLTGIPIGTALMIAIAVANDYTTVIMVRAASKAGRRRACCSMSSSRAKGVISTPHRWAL